MDVDGLREKSTLGGTRSEQDYLYFEPSVGLNFKGSVYHPNQLDFSLSPQIGISAQNVTRDPPGETKQRTSPLQRYHADAILLREKPYAITLYADKDRTFSDFDFFTRARLDATRYGGAAGYGAGTIPFRAEFSHAEQDVTGGNFGSTSRKEDLFSFDANNDHGKNGRASFSYVRDQYDQQEGALSHTEGVDHTASLFDTETLGAGDWIRLNSALLYHRLDKTERGNSGVTLQENLNLKHARNLDSSYQYAFDARSSGPTDTEQHRGSAAVHHLLYGSLSSGLEIHGTTLRSAASDGSLDTTQLGIALREDYSKRLGKWGRLNLGYSERLDSLRQATGGSQISVVHESYTLTDEVVTFLKRPNVVNVTAVSDGHGTPYVSNLDYTLIRHGSMTELRRVPAGRIPNGGTVFVDYTVSTSSGNTTIRGRGNQARLELFDNRIVLYARRNRIDNSGGASLSLQNVDDTVVGTELRWRWFRAGAEDEKYDSNLTPYHTKRLFESFACQPTDDTSLSLDLNQSRTTFPNEERDRTSHSIVGRCSTRLNRFLSYTVEGGVRRDRGNGVDQTLRTVRTTLDFAYAQLTANLGYEFEDEDFLGELRQRHLFFMRARRVY